MRSSPPNPMGGIYSEKHKEGEGGNIKRREAAENSLVFNFNFSYVECNFIMQIIVSVS